MYEVALDCGVPIGEYWELSIQEVADLLESHRRRERGEARKELSGKHFLAKDIAQHVNLIINGSNDGSGPMELWDFFPGLFEEERAHAEKAVQEQALAVYKAQMQDYAYRHNHRNGGGEP